MKNYFKNKHIWLTGASSGIGLALFNILKDFDCDLIISSRREDELKKISLEATAARVRIIPLDLNDLDGLDEVIRMNENVFRNVDILINNAGISQRSLVAETDFNVVEKIMRINYLGTVKISQAILKTFLQRGKGQFVITSSMVGKFGTPYRSAYSASKMALHGYFDVLRAEHIKDNILVTMVCPGFINTPVSLNALTGDGTAQNSMDNATAKGMNPNVFAVKMLRAVAMQQAEVYIGGFKETSFALTVWRFFPSLFRRLIARMKVT